MKKLLLILTITVMTNVLFAQTENYKHAVDSFQTNYNAEKYDAIYDSFSAKMQQALPLEKTNEFLTSLKAQFGNIKDKEFVSYQRGSANYKTQFERAVLTVNIALDDENKINGLSIKPYQEPKANETEAVNALSSYPKEIADLIFAQSKDFPNNTQLSVGIFHDDETHYYGVVKENDTIKPIDNKGQLFEIGSITKVFTSTVLASLVEEGKMMLTDSINNYYPFTFKDSVKITFEHLANHTAGLPRLPANIDMSDEQNPYKSYGEKELNDYLEHLLQLENEPAVVYAYSNLGAGLLGYTLGLSEGMSFQKLLQQRIFSRYEMNDSFTSSDNLGYRLVKGLNTDGEIVSNWDFDALFAAGGIVSTAEDMMRFAKAQFNPANRELTLTREPTFTVNQNMKIGLGWHILMFANDKELFWHNGGTEGYSSSITINIDDKSAVIILSNISAFNPDRRNVDSLGFGLLEIVESE